MQRLLRRVSFSIATMLLLTLLLQVCSSCNTRVPSVSYQQTSMSSLEHYNALSRTRHEVAGANPFRILHTSNTRPTSCKESALMSTHWWGLTVFMNHCLANDLEAGGAAGSVIAEIVAVTNSEMPLVAVPADIIAKILAGASADFAWADSHCGEHGVNFNITWAIVFWIAPIC